MENEVRAFIKLLITTWTCQSYCYFISSRIPKGKLRLISVLPVIYIFILLPLLMSSVILQLGTGFFLAWLANFKLILFCFNKGQLFSSSHSKSSSLLHFMFIHGLPIKIKENPSRNIRNKPYSSLQITEEQENTSLDFAYKILLWCLLERSYIYKDFMHPSIIRIAYTLRMRFLIQLNLAAFAQLTRLVLCSELEPQFDRPYLSTSIQNFWGKRWNLTTSDILKSSIYMPIRSWLTPRLGRRWALHSAILSTFGISGLMHQLLFFYVDRTWPTWEVLWFFMIHGVCLAIEIEVKKGLKGRWMLYPWVSRCLVLGFTLGTASWLCFIPLMKCGADIREIKEYMTLVEYMRYMFI